MSFALREAVRIQELRDADREARAWQIRRGEILRQDRSAFFLRLSERLASEVSTFNSALRLSGNNMLSIIVEPHNIKLYKHGYPGFKREIFCSEDSNEVSVETEIFRTSWGDVEPTSKRLHFDAQSDGNVYLNGQNFVACAEQLLADLLPLFR